MTFNACDHILRQLHGGDLPIGKGDHEFARRLETPLRFGHVILPVSRSRSGAQG
ncbi:MAG: hypothetical protein WAL20_02680 [Rhodomicrobium sp.]